MLAKFYLLGHDALDPYNNSQIQSTGEKFMQELVLATGNKGKVSELEGLLQPLGWQVKPQSQWNFDEVEETGLTFVENAILKARHAAQQTGLPALADDSGLAVTALLGAPGIYSARYAGPGCSDQDNINKLLAALQNTPEAERQASFHCVLVYLAHANDPTPIVCHARWDGMIATAQHGQQGFGYDPVFWLPELNCTAAQLSTAQKQQLSHRGKALRQLVAQLQASL